MLQVARLAPNLLHDAADRVAEFLLEQFNSDGGAKDRAGESDLYYTVFALDGLIALRVDPPIDHVLPYLREFGDGAALDLVHLTCLARCWAAMPKRELDSACANSILERIEAHRSADGGYDATRDSEHGTIYHSFLALGAYQDLAGDLPQPERLAACADALRTDDGAYANDRIVQLGTTPATAGAVTLLRQLRVEIPATVGPWLVARQHKQGGFLALSLAPMPDLLSTATAIHALAALHVPIDGIRERCLDFVDSLWTGRAFCGHWEDDVADCEYTFYALLALGHLSL